LEDLGRASLKRKPFPERPNTTPWAFKREESPPWLSPKTQGINAFFWEKRKGVKKMGSLWFPNFKRVKNKTPGEEMVNPTLRKGIAKP